jgi:hypothetical protein
VFFEREGFPYAIVGAFGLHAYGLSRATSDLDFVTVREAQPKTVEFLEGLGYDTLHVSNGYSNHSHRDPSRGRIDLVYVTGDTARLLFEGSRKSLKLGSREVPVPRPEHLAAMKVHAMKNDPQRAPQETADIRFLMALPGVDRMEIRKYFDDAGLLDRYDEIERLL